MVKKTVKPAKSGNIQRTREEQWKRRLAAQGGTVASGATIDREDMGAVADGAEGGETTYAPRTTTGAGRTANGATTATRTPSTAARSRTIPPSASATQRRMAQPARSNRLKLAANTMTIEEEMHYVRSDIRTLIILTAVCLAVLIALSFVLK